MELLLCFAIYMDSGVTRLRQQTPFPFEQLALLSPSLKECAFAQIQCKQNPDLQLSTGLSSLEPGVISWGSSLWSALLSRDGSVNGDEREHCLHLKLIVVIELWLV